MSGVRLLTFTNEIHDFEPSNEFIFALACQFLEFSHLLEIRADLPQTFLISLLVQLFQQRDVCLKVFIIVANVYKCSKERWWKNDFKSLPVFLD